MLPDVRATWFGRRTAAAVLRLSCVALLPLCLPASHPGLPRGPEALQAPGISGERRTIKVDVALVIVPVVVTDAKGEHVSGLQESDFRIFENELVQKIDRLIPSTEPFHVALLLDRSGSTKMKSEDIQGSAVAFVEALRPQDRFLIASFDTRVTIHADFTNDRSLLQAAIRQIGSSGNSTRLYDAIKTVMTEHLDPLPGRKALVLFTDGVDNDSEQTDAGRTLALIERSDDIGYAIQYDTRLEGRTEPFPLPTSQQPDRFAT